MTIPRFAILAALLGGAALLPVVAARGVTPELRTDLSAKDLARVTAVTRPTTDFTTPEKFELMQGGAGTLQNIVNRDSFSKIAANQSFAARESFNIGNGLFTKFWVSSPSSTEASDGLGPLFNARSCQSCHLKDGRGRPPAEGEPGVSMFLRLSVPPKTDEERQALADRSMQRIPEPTYGGQLQNFGVPGILPEGQMRIDYTEVPVELGDGTLVQLRHPRYSVTDLNYGPMAPDAILSPRVAPPMIGLGLVEEIPAADILAHADPEDTDGDGISGKASMVRDPETGGMTLGRFGWKASASSIKVQAAEAFAGDIGISTPLVTDSFGECSIAQALCRDAPNGVQPRLGEVEAPDPVLDLVTFYSRNLAVPARRDVGAPDVLKGKSLFYSSGCASCHVPKYVTSRDAADAPQAFQLIWPYSDFLLHDMGEGLADGSTNGDATGTEWRTPPLWGIGLTQTVNGHTLFLHDGRARNLTEAILWHGGEAEGSRNSFKALGKSDRDALLVFLESL
ncbi:thiol oxidoreductase [Aureimonas sp. SA4125]|uniref:di-heme oxidoreductase family protein n=1 Tax=Aureimonas sp. SA4125 TaxID=2826993 RepID=UPI001CC6A429|nr:di-heme oxidoredictase family protein [Aureimonas sp. SA4125]BDA86031.1 thiol oxidoreductase [Aureimonas sp. SA4125]